MTRKEIADVIESMGLPCDYYQFPNNMPQVPPFITWFFSRNDDVMADNTNYVDKEVLNVELYTKIKDFDLEQAVERVLSSSGFSYAKESAYVDKEKVWQTSYESEVIINES